MIFVEEGKAYKEISVPLCVKLSFLQKILQLFEGGEKFQTETCDWKGWRARGAYTAQS